MNYNLARYEASYGTSKQLPESDLPEIAFSGRSNVGKSSLLNKITNRKQLARVSGTPGKTVTVNFFRVGDVRLVDLPGYGYARVSESEKQRWADLMEGYFQSGRNIKLVIQLIDMRHEVPEYDADMLRFVQEANIPFVIALTKSDKLNKTERTKRLESLKNELAFLGDYIAIPFSSTKGEGVEELRKVIESAVAV